jgi:plastocyanin
MPDGRVTRAATSLLPQAFNSFRRPLTRIEAIIEDQIMSRSLIGIKLGRVLGTSNRRARGERRKSRAALPFGVESLEKRALLTTVDVHLNNFTFAPAATTIHIGDTIHWVNDQGFHSTTSVAGQSESWDSTAKAAPWTFDHTFTHAGTFTYYCSIHGSDNGNGTASGMSGTITVLPAAATLTAIAVTPANPSIVAGTTDQFTATGTFSDNTTQNITNQVTWASATTTVATINAAGLATGVAPGNSTISATLSGVAGSTVLTVTPPATLQSIVVTPTNPSIAAGLVEPFTATGTFSNNTTQDITSLVTWASATPAVATISNAANLQGVATGVAVGTSTITASLGGVTGSTTLTVTPVVLEMIMVTPVNPSLVQGQTEQFMAMGMYSDNSAQDLTSQVTWASANPAIATIAAGGLATAVAPGTSLISAAFDGMSGSTQFTVNAPSVTMTNVQLVLNKRHMVTQVLVSFTGAVNSAEADKVGTYRLATAGKKGSFDARNAGIIRLKSAALVANNTVRLTPRKAFALSRTVQFRVDGLSPAGLQDSLGRLIDGDRNGQPGGNAIALLSRKGVTIS